MSRHLMRPGRGAGIALSGGLFQEQLMSRRYSRERATRRGRTAVVNACRCEKLETRRLLAFNVSGTSGPDVIEMFHDGTAYRAQVNGLSAGFTTDSDIVISALGGSDTITLFNVKSGTTITVEGGTGSDTFRVASGQILAQLDGRVLVRELAGEGLDEIIVDDTTNNADTERNALFAPDTREGLTHRFQSGTGTDGTGIHFDGNIETFSFFASNAEDTVEVFDVPRGLELSLGGGDDTLIYGDRDTRVLQDVMPLGSVDGGGGADSVVFLDDGGPAQGRAYEFNSNFAMNQHLTSFNTLELNTRNTGGIGGGNTPNSVLFEGGFPVLDDVLINGGGLGDRTFIGTPNVPIDLDNTKIHLTTTNPGHKDIYDQDHTAYQAAFVLVTEESPLRQIVATDFFSAEFIPVSFDVNRNIDIHGGSTDDVFLINTTLPGRNIGIFGGGGDDIVRNNVPADLDAGLLSPIFVAGEEGDDSLILDDSQDEINDDDNEYRFLPGLTFGWVFDKADFNGPVAPLIMYSDDVEQIHLTADDSPNTIRFQGLPTQRLTIDGGGGNDFITNARFGQNGSLVLDHPGSAVIVGGAGNDTISINDQADGLTSEYELTASQFQFRSGLNPPRTLAYDGSIENFFLDQSNASTITRLNGKPAATRLTVSAFAGDDEVIVGGGDIDASGISSATTTLFGGSGEDRIVFDDSLDDHGPLDNDEFHFFPQQINKDATTIVYSAFESQKLITSGVNSSGVAAPNKVRINSINIPTEIEGSAGVRDNMVDINAGVNVSLIAAPITLLFDNAPVVVNVNDQSALGARQFQFSPSQMSLPFVVNYTGVEDLFVYAGASGDTLTVTGTPAGMNVFFNGGGGDENMHLGSGAGAFADLAGRVFANGGDGVDRLFFTNGAAGGFTDGVLLSGGFRANAGPTHLYSANELVNVTVNDQGSHINVTSLTTGAGITGGGGDDLVTVGGGDLDANIRSSIFVFGGGGFDRIVFDDRNGTNQPGTPPEYRFDVFVGTAGPVDRFYANPPSPALDSFFITCLEVEQRQFDASNDPNLINVIDTVGALQINSNGGSDTIAVTDATGLVSVYTGSGADQLTINTDSGSAGDGPVTVRLDRSDDLNTLDVRPGGTLDLADNDLIVNYSSVSPIGVWTGSQYDGLTGYIQSGRIVSSLASGTLKTLGVAEAREALSITGTQTTTFSGHSVDSTAVLVKFTSGGDANLDGKINIDDYGRIDGNVAQSGSVFGWFFGDFNLDGKINIDDYGIIDGNINQQDEIL